MDGEIENASRSRFIPSYSFSVLPLTRESFLTEAVVFSHEPRDGWTHTVTGAGSERSLEYSWVELPTTAEFALSLDDYLHLIA